MFIVSSLIRQILEPEEATDFEEYARLKWTMSWGEGWRDC